jgi:hypothetical protein
MTTTTDLIATPPPAEPYNDLEQAHLDRLASHENPLGWTLAGRDSAGNLVFTAEIDGGRRGDRRRCAQILTPGGLVSIG